MENFSVRAANINDAESIAQVQYQGWQDTYKHIYPAEYLNKLPVKTDMWRQILSGISSERIDEVLVNSQNEVIGFVSAGKNRFNELKTDGEIFALYLLKTYHGKGLGKLLFLGAVERLLEIGCRSFCLFVLTQNPSIQFYRKFNPDMEIQVKDKREGKEYDETGLGWTNIENIKPEKKFSAQ